jgi:hypothetical protein
MEPSATKDRATDRSAPDAEFGTGRLFLADSRMALALLNSARSALLRSRFGMSREQANIVTVVGALVAADAAYETARRVVRTPLRVSGADIVLAGFALREVALGGVAGPASRDVRLFGTLVAGAMLAGLALPALRQAAHSLRATEHQLRERRIDAYRAAMRAVRADA